MLSKRALRKIKINNAIQQLLFNLHHVFFFFFVVLCYNTLCHSLAAPTTLRCIALHCERIRIWIYTGRHAYVFMYYVKWQKSKCQCSPRSPLHPRCITLHCIRITFYVTSALRRHCVRVALHIGIVFASRYFIDLLSFQLPI